VDELGRRARLHGWFVTSLVIGEETWWQWRRVAEPDDGRHPMFRDEAKARLWMRYALDNGTFAKPGLPWDGHQSTG